jgi:voltage-gated potassium channel
MIPMEDLSKPVRQFWIAVLLLLLLVVLAAGYYLNVEAHISHTPWTAPDALFMAVSTIATLGGEVHPLSQQGRLFTTLYAVTGIILVAVAARSAASLVLSEQLGAQFLIRRRQRILQQLSEHYIVCGYGRMGQEAVRQLLRRGVKVAVIEQDPNLLADLGSGDLPFVEGNATQDEHLRAAGVERARGLIAAVGTDEDNVFVVLSARLLNPALYIVARAGREENVDKLTRAGANRVLSPFVVGGRSLAAAAVDPGLSDFLEMVLHQAEMDVEIASIALPPHSPAIGKAMSGAGLLLEQGAMILAVMDRSGQFHTNPHPRSQISEGDRLIAMGTREQLAQLRRAVGWKDA